MQVSRGLYSALYVRRRAGMCLTWWWWWWWWYRRRWFQHYGLNLINLAQFWVNSFVRIVNYRISCTCCIQLVWTSLRISDQLGYSLAFHPKRTVSYLPLSHVAAQVADVYVPIIDGSATYFAQPDAMRVQFIQQSSSKWTWSDSIGRTSRERATISWHPRSMMDDLGREQQNAPHEKFRQLSKN